MSVSNALLHFVHWVDGTEETPESKQNIHSAVRKTNQVSENKSLVRNKQQKLARERKYEDVLYRAAATLVCVAMISVLLVTVSWLPRFGSDANPEENEVYARYVEDGLREAGAVNTVADMILDYRAFDTLGESNVLFIAVCSVMILLRAEKKKNGAYLLPELAVSQKEEKGDPVFQAAARVLVPVGLLYGIYVILNGHLSAGGGFSGGAIIGGCLVMYVNAFGSEKFERFFTVKTYQWITFFSLMTYTLLKTYSFYTGANGIESGIPLGTPGAILSSGLILPLNICVGLVVACTMYAFYALFAKGGFGHGR